MGALQYVPFLVGGLIALRVIWRQLAADSDKAIAALFGESVS